tara:strand:+ start:2241 stop:2474 length:234 start_codon:yes stop_codon:yes gene_type:complete
MKNTNNTASQLNTSIGPYGDCPPRSVVEREARWKQTDSGEANIARQIAKFGAEKVRLGGWNGKAKNRLGQKIVEVFC